KTPPPVQRRGLYRRDPAVPPCSGALTTVVAGRASTLGGLAPATPARPTATRLVGSPERLGGEFRVLPPPGLHHPRLATGRRLDPYYSPSTPYMCPVVPDTVHGTAVFGQPERSRAAGPFSRGRCAPPGPPA